MMTEEFLFPSQPKPRVVQFVEFLRDRLLVWRQAKLIEKSLRDLAEMDERRLLDIGLTRHDIDNMWPGVTR